MTEDTTHLPIIEARGLSKRYGRGTLALDDVTFTIGSGRIVGLMGANGAGKTTALKAILGLTPFKVICRYLAKTRVVNVMR